MSRHPLDGVASKLKRAEEHLQALDAELPGFLERKPHRFVGQLDTERGRYSVFIKIREEPPLRWSILLGDLVHNLRSGLDHLLWQLVIVSGSQPHGGNQFPIFSEEPVTGKPRERWERMTKGLRTDILKAVTEVQPYTTPDRVQESSLAILNALSNEDKHRLPVACVGAIEAHDKGMLELVNVCDVEPGPGYNVRYGKPLKDGDEVVWIENVRTTGPNPGMEVKGDLPFNVAFGRVLVDRQGLADMVDHVGLLATMFGKQFFAGSPTAS